MPAVKWISPDGTYGLLEVTNAASVDPVELLGAQIRFDYEPDPDQQMTAVALTVAERDTGRQIWSSAIPPEEVDPDGGRYVVRVSDNTGVDMVPGAVYSITATLTDTLATQAFALDVHYPIAQGFYYCTLGPEPKAVAVDTQLTAGNRDAWYQHYAKSSTPDELGIVGGWSDTVPWVWEAGTDWHLLIRPRLVRIVPGYDPDPPSGIERITVRWLSPVEPGGAFQPSAFQNDAYQVLVE